MGVFHSFLRSNASSIYRDAKLFRIISLLIPCTAIGGNDYLFSLALAFADMQHATHINTKISNTTWCGQSDRKALRLAIGPSAILPSLHDVIFTVDIATGDGAVEF